MARTRRIDTAPTTRRRTKDLPDESTPTIGRVPAALAWKRAAIGTHLFAGAHVDVEPYALAGWSKPASQAKLITATCSRRGHAA